MDVRLSSGQGLNIDIAGALTRTREGTGVARWININEILEGFDEDDIPNTPRARMAALIDQQRLDIQAERAAKIRKQEARRAEAEAKAKASERRRVRVRSQMPMQEAQ